VGRWTACSRKLSELDCLLAKAFGVGRFLLSYASPSSTTSPARYPPTEELSLLAVLFRNETDPAAGRDSRRFLRACGAGSTPAASPECFRGSRGPKRRPGSHFLVPALVPIRRANSTFPLHRA